MPFRPRLLGARAGLTRPIPAAEPWLGLTGPGGVCEVVVGGAPGELLQLPAAQVQGAGGGGFVQRPFQGPVPRRRRSRPSVIPDQNTTWDAKSGYGRLRRPQ